MLTSKLELGDDSNALGNLDYSFKDDTKINTKKILKQPENYLLYKQNTKKLDGLIVRCILIGIYQSK